MSRTPFDDNQELEDLEAVQETVPESESDTAAQPGTSSDLEKLRAERDALFERLARVSAEFRNSQRRLEQEKEQSVQYANSSLLKALLPVLDNLERALAVDPDKTDAASILKGMQIVYDQWQNLLKQQKVELIAPEPGTPFDPSQHEALMQQDSEYTSPTVTQLFQKGYSMHGRTLRPAQVAVSRSS